MSVEKHALLQRDALRVLIADDHPIFRNGMRALLTSVSDLEVAGEAVNGDEAIDLAASLQPDVVLMDLYMPGGVGGRVNPTRRSRPSLCSV